MPEDTQGHVAGQSFVRIFIGSRMGVFVFLRKLGDKLNSEKVLSLQFIFEYNRGDVGCPLCLMDGKVDITSFYWALFGVIQLKDRHSIVIKLIASPF